MYYPDVYDRLLKFAANNPDLREDWGPVCDHVYAEMRRTRQAARSKIAYKPVTARFINWVTMTQKRSPVSEKNAQDMLERVFKLETQQPADQKRGGPRYSKGDMVKIQAEKHKIGHTQDIYSAHNGKIGTVVSTPAEDRSLADSDHGDVLVDFGSGAPIRFPDAMKARGVGIYKDDGSYDMKSAGAELEMIYFSAKERPPTKEQMQEVEAYIERGAKVGEERLPYYYSGVPQMAAYSNQGNFYFKINPQQRTSKWRAYSPKKGTLLYLGVKNSRPSGWEREYEKLIHEG